MNICSKRTWWMRYILCLAVTIQQRQFLWTDHGKTRWCGLRRTLLLLFRLCGGLGHTWITRNTISKSYNRPVGYNLRNLVLICFVYTDNTQVCLTLKSITDNWNTAMLNSECWQVKPRSQQNELKLNNDKTELIVLLRDIVNICVRIWLIPMVIKQLIQNKSQRSLSYFRSVSLCPEVYGDPSVSNSRFLQQLFSSTD